MLKIRYPVGVILCSSKTAKTGAPVSRWSAADPASSAVCGR
jgi:hypothetical protein